LLKKKKLSKQEEETQQKEIEELLKHSTYPRDFFEDLNNRAKRSLIRSQGGRVSLKGEERQEQVAIRLTLPKKLLTKFDQYCENEDYTRVEGIRQAMRDTLREAKFDEKESSLWANIPTLDLLTKKKFEK